MTMQSLPSREAVAQEMARRKLLNFIQYVKPDYSTQPFHRILCGKIDSWYRGETKKNLMVFMPPQHGKSEIVSRKLPAHLLGRNPALKIIHCSYASALIQGMNRSIQRCIDSEAYARLFPLTRLSGKGVKVDGTWSRNNEEFEIIGYGGNYRCAGVGGGVGGFPADIILGDDFYKDYQQAQSPAYRKQVWEWYTSTFAARTHGDSRKLLTFTRWHEFDLAGMLLKLEPEEWDVLKLPAICVDPTAPDEYRQEGEALWEGKFPAEMLLKRKKLNPHQYVALYDQNPRPTEGRLFQDATHYHTPPEEVRYELGCDLAYTKKKRSNYSSVVVRAKSGGKTYIVRVERWQEAIGVTIEKLRRIQSMYHVPFHIEANGPQVAVCDTIESAGVRITRHQPVGDKYARAQKFAEKWNAGEVLVPHEADWLAAYLAELYDFTGMGEESDDQVDASNIGFGEEKTLGFS